MPIAKVQFPDGRIGRFEVPEGTTPEEVEAFAMETFKEQPPTIDTTKGQSPVDSEGIDIPQELFAAHTAQDRPGAFEGPMSVAALSSDVPIPDPDKMTIPGIVEPMATIATGAVAEPVSGLAGIAGG
jgi:hypothetical protein